MPDKEKEDPGNGGITPDPPVYGGKSAFEDSEEEDKKKKKNAKKGK